MWLTGSCSPMKKKDLELFKGESGLNVVCVTTRAAALSKLAQSLRKEKFEDIDSVLLMCREDEPRPDQGEFLNCLKRMVQWLGKDRANSWMKKTSVVWYSNEDKFVDPKPLDEKKAQGYPQKIKDKYLSGSDTPPIVHQLKYHDLEDLEYQEKQPDDFQKFKARSIRS